MTATPISGELCSWVHYDAATPITYALQADSVALSFGRGELELALTEAALERLVAVGGAALRALRDGTVSPAPTPGRRQ
ncbi:hypothetical protein [Saccharothrix obliqua]|uniref:hypothetical protein n=1 Tax=Saccharothrix obliqua TaxID=2861747 RepID=UPI001C5D3E7D|nr:hypothetical protein [Saccharothrix obliqua]MBW4721242.1 hypothetical protein [Saccharothrix obliqua]